MVFSDQLLPARLKKKTGAQKAPKAPDTEQTWPPQPGLTGGREKPLANSTRGKETGPMRRERHYEHQMRIRVDRDLTTELK